MIQYDTKDWADSLWKIGLSIGLGKNYRTFIIAIFMVILYSSIITVLNITIFEIKFRIDPFFFSLLGLILSLFLVFRLNSAFNKWWEGRTLWGTLVNRTRTLSAYLSSLIPEDDQNSRLKFARQLGNFAYAVKGHLRADIQYKDFDPIDDKYIERLKKCDNIPHHITRMIFRDVEDLYKQNKITDGDKINIKNEISVMLDVLGGCEKILNTPIPFSHSSFFKSFIIIYIFSLPFGFVNAFLYFTIPATVLISFALLGIEIISEEIEDPFGKDPNDLPLTHLSNVIRRNIYNLLMVPAHLPQVVEPVTGSRHFVITH